MSQNIMVEELDPAARRRLAGVRHLAAWSADRIGLTGYMRDVHITDLLDAALASQDQDLCLKVVRDLAKSGYETKVGLAGAALSAGYAVARAA